MSRSIPGCSPLAQDSRSIRGRLTSSAPLILRSSSIAADSQANLPSARSLRCTKRSTPAITRAPALAFTQTKHRTISKNQSRDLFARVRLASDRGRVSARIELANGSRIVSLPGSEISVRGYSNVALLVIDEAARVEDDLYQAVRPMLAVSRGRTVILTTPFGKRGFFWNVWAMPEGWKRVRVTAYDCPRIDPAWLEAEKQQIPDIYFKSEYMCEFVEQADQVFRLDDIEAAFGNTEEATDGTPLRSRSRSESGLHSISAR